jgi:4-hydroxybenzoate polyprenyltransferase
MIAALIKSMRPKQWVKSVFIFTALIFDRKLLDQSAFLHTLAGAILFSLISSAVYIINDIADLEADQNHPKKKLRPIASGKLPIPVAWAAGIGLILISLPLAYKLSPAFFGICTVYLTLNLFYSSWLKHVPLIDVLVLASFYILRVTAGVTLIEVKRFSPWLYVVTSLFALFIGLGKRRAELVLQINNSSESRTFSAPNLPENHSMMLTIPFVLYGIFRYLYLIQVGEGGAPEDIALSDRPLQAAILLWSFTILMIFYFY